MIAKKQNRTTHEVDEKPTLPFVMIPLYLPRLQKKTRRKKNYPHRAQSYCSARQEKEITTLALNVAIGCGIFAKEINDTIKRVHPG